MQLNTVKAEQFLQLNDLRTHAASSIDAKSIHRLGKADLLRLQTALGLGTEWGVIHVPAEWMPNGASKNPNRRIQYLDRICGVAGAESEARQLAITVATRYALMLFMAPNPISGYLKPSTVITNLLRAMYLFRVAVTRPPVKAGYLLDRLKHGEFADKGSNTEINRLRHWASKGWWDDLPQGDLYSKHEPSRRGQDETPLNSQSRDNDPWQPLPDSFVADAGARVLWLVEQLGPSIIRCANGMLQAIEGLEISKFAHGTQRKKRREAASEFLQHFEWTDANGNHVDKLPFHIGCPSDDAGQKVEKVWPPRGMVEVKTLLRLLQSSHLFIVLLSTGARIGEALSLRDGCLVESAVDGAVINGKTFKLKAMRGGEERDWPLAEIGASAIQQQERVSECIRRWNRITNKSASFKEVDSIWRLPRHYDTDDDAADVGYNDELKAMVVSFQIASSLGDKPMHAHRCRKTLARLLALCIVGAPKIVMDLFGHKNIEMTLSYILSDPLIRAEMVEVAQAQTIMLAADAMAHADENGGPAASVVKEAVRQEQIRLGKGKLGIEDLGDLADTATLSGKTWSLVRPGVVCTKGPKQAGPCTRNVGSPEPSRCRSSCGHRLEEYFLRDDVDKTLDLCTAELDNAIKNEESHQAEYWIGQICANINRFQDLRLKWESHPMVRYAIENSAERNPA